MHEVERIGDLADQLEAGLAGLGARREAVGLLRAGGDEGDGEEPDEGGGKEKLAGRSGRFDGLHFPRAQFDLGEAEDGGEAEADPVNTGKRLVRQHPEPDADGEVDAMAKRKKFGLRGDGVEPRHPVRRGPRYRAMTW